jgi:hypothetical protein
MYSIIEKVQLVDGLLDRSPLGYVCDDCDMTSFKVEEQVFYDWVEENKLDLENGTKDVSAYVETYGAVYLASTGSATIDGLGLTLIADIDNPEAV